jgi:hypothetical protein
MAATNQTAESMAKREAKPSRPVRTDERQPIPAAGTVSERMAVAEVIGYRVGLGSVIQREE